MTPTCWHASGSVPFPRSSKIICVRIWEGIRHIIVRLCIMMPSAAQICARINTLFMFKWHTLLKLSLRLSAFLSPVSSRSCSLASFVPHLFFLSQLKSVRQLYGLLFRSEERRVGKECRSTTFSGLNCIFFFFFFVCACLYVRDRGEKEGGVKWKRWAVCTRGREREGERGREGGWVRLAMWVGLGGCACEAAKKKKI